jgi:hypothetical protein
LLQLGGFVSLGSGRVTRVLDEIIAEHGRPESLRSDNGPEFCSRRMRCFTLQDFVSTFSPARLLLRGEAQQERQRKRHT